MLNTDALWVNCFIQLQTHSCLYFYVFFCLISVVLNYFTSYYIHSFISLLKEFQIPYNYNWMKIFQLKAWKISISNVPRELLSLWIQFNFVKKLYKNIQKFTWGFCYFKVWKAYYLTLKTSCFDINNTLCWFGSYRILNIERLTINPLYLIFNTVNNNLFNVFSW